MKFLCSFSVGLFFFSFVHLGSFSPTLRKDESGHQTKHIPKDKLAFIRDFVASLELKDLKNEGDTHHKFVEAIKNDEREPSIRDEDFHTEVKRQPFDYSGHKHYGRTGKRISNSNQKFSKLTKLKPLKNNGFSGRKGKRVSVQKQLQNGNDVMPDLSNVYNKQRQSKAVERDSSSLGLNDNTKGYDSEFDDIDKSDFQNELTETRKRDGEAEIKR